MADLKNLMIAKLDYTSLDDKGITSLKSLPKLRELSLDSTSITDQGALALQSMSSFER